jgi:hypothetical protein
MATADDLPLARDGDLTDCGAVLISTEGAAFEDALKIASRIESGQLTELFDIHFVVKDEKTGRPRPHLPYRLTLPDGQEVRGTTDGSGFTEKIGADFGLIARLEVPYYGDDISCVPPANLHELTN